MPKLKCKEDGCKKWVKVPPNRPTATGYCRGCWMRKKWVANMRHRHAHQMGGWVLSVSKLYKTIRRIGEERSFLVPSPSNMAQGKIIYCWQCRHRTIHAFNGKAYACGTCGSYHNRVGRLKLWTTLSNAPSATRPGPPRISIKAGNVLNVGM